MVTRPLPITAGGTLLMSPFFNCSFVLIVGTPALQEIAYVGVNDKDGVKD